MFILILKALNIFEPTAVNHNTEIKQTFASLEELQKYIGPK